MSKYEVPVVYRGQDNFIVEVENPREAEEIAIARFNNGDTPDILGTEWERIEYIGQIELVEKD
jgi:hypothetical protein